MMADESGEAMTLQPSVINAKATQMFTGGDGAPRRSGEGAVATAPTLWLIKLAKEAVFELFLHHRDEVQRSWGTMLDQEEAVGHLVCDALGLEILPEEARTIADRQGGGEGRLRAQARRKGFGRQDQGRGGGKACQSSPGGSEELRARCRSRRSLGGD